MSAEESISVFSRLFGASMYADLRMWDEILIWSCLQGVMGEIHTTSEEYAAMAILGDFAFYR